MDVHGAPQLASFEKKNFCKRRHLGVEGVHVALHEHGGQHQVLEALDAAHRPRLIVVLERLRGKTVVTLLT